MQKVLFFFGCFFILTTTYSITNTFKSQKQNYFKKVELKSNTTTSNSSGNYAKVTYTLLFKNINIAQDLYSNTESESSVIFKEPDNSIQKNFINWLFILNAILGIFIALRIILKHTRTNSNNLYFGIFLTGVSLMLLELALFWWEGLNYNPRISFFRVQFYLWIPSLFLYLKNNIKKTATNNKLEIIAHYIPSIIILACALIVYTFSSDIALDLINSLSLKAIHTTIYLILLIYFGLKHKKEIQKINKNWLITLIVFTSIVLVLLITRALFSNDITVNTLTIYFAAILFSIFINIISIILFLQSNIIVNNIENFDKEKYKNSGLTTDMLKSLKIQLEELLKNKKVFLDNNLTLEDLANKLNTDRYSLSQTINQEFGKNYYELINDYRVNEAVRIIHDSKKDILISDLIFESGFNNKVSFYKAFKKRHNKTPLEYQKLVAKENKNLL